jgi:hypothetical protein
MSDHEPVKASDVAKSTEKSADELRREKAKKIAHGVVAKRAALRRAGVDAVELGQSSPELAERLEQSLKKRDREVRSRHAASREGLKAAVKMKLKEER